MKILVTGAEGFIGSHLVEGLIKKRYKVKALVLYNSFNSLGWIDTLPDKTRKTIEIALGDIRDKEFIDKYLKDVDVVINLAALISIPYSYQASRSYIDTNVNGLLNILTASLSSKVKQVIQISTSEVYGTPKKIPIKEDFPLNAQSPYAASKIAADQLALSFHKSFGLPVSIIRPFNTYGPRQSTRAIIPTIITQALQNKKIEIGSLFPKRDLLFVEDTVNGIIAAIGNKRSLGKVINLGSGFEISIKDLANKICKILGIKKKLKHSKLRVRPKKSEVQRLLASTKEAKKILRWSPKIKGIKGLESGLTKTILWFKQKKNLKNYKSSNYNY
tara:strand:- start:457 stop:1449 length:993 start_codon:yes stop_codon:yes gene_type:complete